MNQPQFPPLLSGLGVDEKHDPMEVAISQAMQGCDAGLIVHNLGPNTLRAAIVLAPEVPLKQAMAMLPACGIGFQNALGALSPPEVAVHLQWDGGLRLNGARCGGLRVAASDTTVDAIPSWLVIGLSLALWPAQENTPEIHEQTTLYAEGCGDVDALVLLESWAKHTLVWINRWSEGGTAPLYAQWHGLVDGIGEPMDYGGKSGTFTGVDEDFGLLLRSDDRTNLFPLTTLLER